MSNLSTRFKTLLDEKRLSMNAFAKQVGVSQPAIAKIASGETLNPKNILEIATALGVNAHWLKTGEGERDADVFAFTSEKDDDHTLRVDLLDA